MAEFHDGRSGLAPAPLLDAAGQPVLSPLEQRRKTYEAMAAKPGFDGVYGRLLLEHADIGEFIRKEKRRGSGYKETMDAIVCLLATQVTLTSMCSRDPRAAAQELIRHVIDMVRLNVDPPPADASQPKPAALQ